MRQEQMSEHMERLRAAACNALTEEDVREIFKGLVERAKRGDREAVRTVLAYLTPPPEPAPRNQLNVLNLRAKANGRQPRLIEQNGTET